jgi:hypothetical protein
MSVDVRWRDRAIHEAQEAYDWYESRSKGTGERLIAELDEHIDFLMKHHSLARAFTLVPMQPARQLHPNFVHPDRRVHRIPRWRSDATPVVDQQPDGVEGRVLGMRLTARVQCGEAPDPLNHFQEQPP